MSSPHTEHGLHHQPKPGKPSSANTEPTWWNTILIVFCIVLAYLVAMQNDELDDLRMDLIQQQLDSQIDLGHVERLAVLKIADAYAQGQRDALDSLQPQAAMQVAQLCQAWHYQVGS